MRTGPIGKGGHRPARGGDDTAGLGERLRRDAMGALAGAPLYRHTLIGRVPADLRIKLADPWPGDPKRGAAIAKGEIEFAGETVRNPDPRWFPPDAASPWLAEWHGFGWLADLTGAGAGARDTARGLVQDWLAAHDTWHPLAWRADVLGTRIFCWIAHFDDLVGREADPLPRRRLLASLAAQLRHLARTATWEVAGAARLRALKGLLAGLAAISSSQPRMARALRALDREISAQILRDGGHITRCPSLQMQVLQDLIDVRAVLRAAKSEIPAGLQDAIARMAPMLRFFRHGDRRLALFNDGLEEDGVLIDLVLTRAEARERAPAQAPQSGFQRLAAGKSLVLVDAGGPPPRGFDEHAHAGVLSFELSCERERIIVNCGAYRGPKRGWEKASRASAAHSVLVVADTNSAEIRPDGTIGRGPTAVTCERAEQDGQQWILASHDGYRQRFGLSYTRQLFLAADGEDLRGEDRLSGRPGANFAVRFHLHPGVQAALTEDGAAALLRLPSGNLWRLRASGGEMSLGESIYMGSGEARKTQQVVLSGKVGDEGAAVRWAIRREPRQAAGS